MDGFAALFDEGHYLLNDMLDALYFAAAWAKEWQSLLAGLLIVFAAFIFARATLTAARIRAAAVMQAGAAAPDRSPVDLRQAAKASSWNVPVIPNELASGLEQLRSLIRSTLSSLNLATEKENGLAHFLCQRILHLQLERFALPANPAMAARELHIRLLEQLEQLRSALKKEAAITEIAEILVQLNTTARNLASALPPVSDKRLQAERR